ncbi:hypothetical protein Nepgr_022680 [Nepenthes gracilis]|uniref:Uncharacterized protein n=1 Tax=Nepenthes gracilis TaxID=150966 RepID=A0AAD3SZI7_NEPGR|nr:hypothetical protein Nepgr_022680 [Nepenthes gracilis]
MTAARGEKSRGREEAAGFGVDGGWVVSERPAVARRAAGQRSGGSGAAGNGRQRPRGGEREARGRQERERIDWSASGHPFFRSAEYEVKTSGMDTLAGART